MLTYQAEEDQQNERDYLKEKVSEALSSPDNNKNKQST